jgi:hypothetical protein
VSRRLSARLLGVALAAGLAGLSPAGAAEGADMQPGDVTVRTGFGVLGNTPDGTAFAASTNIDFFVLPGFSVGPLFQLAFTGDSTQFGLSGQLKYWFAIPGTDRQLTVTPQAGIGFIHNSFREGDTSWLVPVGLSVDYRVTRWMSLDGTFLMNFTDLDTGRGTGATFMPGFTLGVRF